MKSSPDGKLGKETEVLGLQVGLKLNIFRKMYSYIHWYKISNKTFSPM